MIVLLTYSAHSQIDSLTVDPSKFERTNTSLFPDSPNRVDSDGRRHGQWTIWLTKTHYETSDQEFVYFYRLATYEHGNIVGTVRDYYPEGTLAAEGNIQNEFWHGPVKFYDENGDLEKIIDYQNGVENGEWIKYSDGKKIIEGQYEDGRRTGIWRGFNPDGSAKFEGRYVAGQRYGIWRHYDNSHNINKINIYYDGYEIPEKNFGLYIKEFIEMGKPDKVRKYSRYFAEFMNLNYGRTSYQYNLANYWLALAETANKHYSAAARHINDALEIRTSDSVSSDFRVEFMTEFIRIQSLAGMPDAAAEYFPALLDTLEKRHTDSSYIRRRKIAAFISTAYINQSEYRKALAVLDSIGAGHLAAQASRGRDLVREGIKSLTQMDFDKSVHYEFRFYFSEIFDNAAFCYKMLGYEDMPEYYRNAWRKVLDEAEFIVGDLKKAGIRTTIHQRKIPISK